MSYSIQPSFPRNCLTAHPYTNARFPARSVARLKRWNSCLGITVSRTYLANIERQEPTAHRRRRQQPPHRDGHFAG